MKQAQRLDSPNNIRWQITVEPGSRGDVTVVLPVTQDCDVWGPSAPGTAGGSPTDWSSQLAVRGSSRVAH